MKPLPVKYLLVGLAVASILMYFAATMGTKAGEQAGKDSCTQNLFPNA